MTNYTSFPKWRDNGIVMKFNEHCYSWSANTTAQRRYLLESDYCNNVVEIYVWENDTTYTTVDDFKQYLRDFKGFGNCPKCGKKLVLMFRKKDYDSRFLGCSGYPECKFAKKA